MRAARIAVDLRIRDEVHPLPSSVELSIYRIVQEALTNVVKHAAPAKAVVDVRFGTVDGGGFRVPARLPVESSAP